MAISSSQLFQRVLLFLPAADPIDRTKGLGAVEKLARGVNYAQLHTIMQKARSLRRDQCIKDLKAEKKQQARCCPVCAHALRGAIG